MTSPSSLLRLSMLALLWGSSFLWIKFALGAFTPVQLVAGRLALAALVLLAICRTRRIPLPRGGRLWGKIAIAALFANTLPFTLFGYGEQTVDSGLAGVLNGTTPLWTMIITLVIGQERSLGPTRTLGLVLGFAGTLLIFSPWQSGGNTLSPGALAVLGAALSYAISTVYIARNLTGHGAPPVAAAASQMLAATGWAVLALPMGGLQLPHWNPLGVLALAILGVFGTGLAFIVYYRLITDEGAIFTATVTYLMPVVAILLGTVVFSEELQVHVLAGMAVVLAGVALTQRRGPARERDGGRAERDLGEVPAKADTR